MTASFLPDDYVMAATGGAGAYTKLKEGETRLRILSNPVIGFEYWNNDNKPVRTKQNPGAKPADMRQADSNGRPERVKEFWAMKAYNYAEQRMEVFQITQAQIKNALAELSRDEDYGHPKQYDIKIKRSGSGLNTEYSVIASPPKAVSQEVKDAYGAQSITLEALFDGGNPFGGAEAMAANPSGQPPLERKPAAQRQQAAAPKKPAPEPVEETSELPF